MRKIEGSGEIRLPINDEYGELWYDLDNFDIELIGWRSEDGYNRSPIFRLTPKEDEDDEADEHWEDDN